MMHTKTITTRALPFEFLTRQKYKRGIKTSIPWRVFNVLLGVCIVLTIAVQVVLVNYLNTATLRLQELADTEASISSDISDLNASILEVESLDVVTKRAREIGMTSEGTVIYLTTDEPAYVKR